MVFLIGRFCIYPQILFLYWCLLFTCKKHGHWHGKSHCCQCHHLCYNPAKPVEVLSNCDHLSCTWVQHICPCYPDIIDSSSNTFKRIIVSVPIYRVWVPLLFTFHHRAMTTHKIFLCLHTIVIIQHHDPQLQGCFKSLLGNVQSMKQPSKRDILCYFIYRIPRCPDLIGWSKW